jgi:ankyrin repeat protein
MTNDNQPKNLSKLALRGMLTKDDIINSTKRDLEKERDGLGLPLLYNVCNAETATSVEIIEAILDAGVNINLLTPNGHTALMAAAANNRYDTVKLLLQRGANAQLLDNTNSSALHYAAGLGVEENIIKILIEQGGGVDPLVKNIHGHTAADLARQREHTSTALLIEQYYAPTKSASFVA